MKKRHGHQEFCCPEVIPPGAPDEFGLLQACCQDKIETPNYPSATTCLPEDVQLELEERIGRVNRLLLDLALSGKQPEEARRRAFDGVVGEWVKVRLNNAVQTRKKQKKARIRKKQQKAKKSSLVKGCVRLVGWNFVYLVNENKHYYIPFSNIKLISLEDEFQEQQEKMELHDIDPCLRRELAFNFGETVASSPELIQIFFRIRLSIYLLLLLDKKIQLYLDNQIITGTVVDVKNETVTVWTVKSKVEKTLSLEAINLITLEE